MSKVILECLAVAKSFIEAGGSRLEVLRDINFKISAGEQVAIMGRSGAGKTTLLQLLGGLDAPTKGQVNIMGQDIHQIKEFARATMRNKSLGFIYQAHNLLPEFTALENVAMPLLIANMEVKLAQKKAQVALTAVGLEHRILHKPGELSGGERQRVAVARAIVREPDCILADEPTGNLDSDNAKIIFDLMLDINKRQNTSLVLVTHDKHLAEKMQHVYYLADGGLKLLA